MKRSEGVISSEVPWRITLAQFHRGALNSVDKTYTVLTGGRARNPEYVYLHVLQ